MSIEELLPPGWVVLRDCSIGTGPGEALREAPLPIPLVLLHSEVGVALLETGPGGATPGAEAALRRRLEAARFAGIFAGHLPVLHRRIAPAELPAIRGILAEGFAALPPLTLPGGDAWVGVVRRALLPRDPSRSGAPPLGMAATDTPDWHDVAAGEDEEPATADRAGASRRVLPDRLAAAPSPGGVATAGAAQPGGAGDDLPAAAAAAAPAWWRRPGTWAAAGLGAVVVAGALAFLGEGGPEAARPGPAPPPPLVAAPAPPVLPPSPAGPPSSREPVRPAVPGGPAAPSAPAVPPPRSSQAEGAAAPLPAAAAPATVVVRTRANLRTGPNDRAPVLRILPRGQSLRLLDRAPGGWVQVGDPQPIGWVHSSLLEGAEP